MTAMPEMHENDDIELHIESDPVVAVPKGMLKDPALSMTAKGVYAMLADGGALSQVFGPDGEPLDDEIAEALRALARRGWITRTANRITLRATPDAP